MKRLLVLILVVTSLLSIAGCGTNVEEPIKPDTTEKQKESEVTAKKEEPAEPALADEIYFLNFKPEVTETYEKILKDFEAETGIHVKMETAASGTYERVLTAEVAKTDAPTIFQINGPIGYSNWSDYCLDLKDTKLYSYLSDKSLAVTKGDGVYGIPYAVEGYGIIYNDAILRKYFALSDKAVSISSAEEIKDFNTLKAVVEDMTAKKDQLGIKGVFAATSLKPGEDWRWQTHLANVPFFYEFNEAQGFDDSVLAGLAAEEIEFKYSNNFRNLFDLYLNNSSTDKKLLGSKSVDDSMAEMALGQVAMVQNGNWAWGQIGNIEGNVVNAEDVKFMPLYTGMPDDQKQGLCVGTENFFSINSKVSKEKQDASILFLEWLFSTDKGKAYVANDLGFTAPFNTFTDAEKPTDPLAKDVANWMAKDGVTSVPWTFAAFPSQTFKDDFGAALLEYAQGGKTWDEVVTIVKEGWKSEKEALAAVQ
jgi:raffinose/stachyose/melibiose transport system substrate-binding protein